MLWRTLQLDAPKYRRTRNSGTIPKENGVHSIEPSISIEKGVQSRTISYHRGHNQSCLFQESTYQANWYIQYGTSLNVVLFILMVTRFFHFIVFIISFIIIIYLFYLLPGASLVLSVIPVSVPPLIRGQLPTTRFCPRPSKCSPSSLPLVEVKQKVTTFAFFVKLADKNMAAHPHIISHHIKIIIHNATNNWCILDPGFIWLTQSLNDKVMNELSRKQLSQRSLCKPKLGPSLKGKTFKIFLSKAATLEMVTKFQMNI